MATTRKRTTGFSEKPKEQSVEEIEIEQMLDMFAQETLENLSKEEEGVSDFIPQEITPTEDVGPRFVESVPPQPAETPVAQAQVLPKRHPRNIPKFSRFK